MLIILWDLQNTFNPNDGLDVDAFSPQQHVLGHSFSFSQHTLNGSNVLTEDQEEDMLAHRPGMVDPCLEENSPASVLARKIGDTLRLPFYGYCKW